VDAGTAGEVLLVPDCGPGTGLGHLERLLAVADALRETAAHCTVAVPHGDAALRQRVAARGHAPVEMPGDVADRAVAACSEVSPDAVVLDAYGVPVAVHSALRRQCSLVVVDDLQGDCDCDLAVNPSPGGEAMRPRGAATFLGGARYSPLSSAYLEARAQRDERGAEARTVLLSTGATALGGLGAQLARELLRCDAGVRVLAVAGPEVDTAALPVDPRVELLEMPATLGPSLARATVYAGAAGQTSLQAACVGVPAVLVAAVDNQQAQARALEAAGCAMRATADGAAAAAVALLDDSDRLAAMARCGRELIDGRGAERVAEAVLALVAGRARA